VLGAIVGAGDARSWISDGFSPSLVAWRIQDA